MASQGPLGGATGANTTLAGSNASWTNPNQVNAIDNSPAYWANTGSTGYSDYLAATGFGFSIPGGNTINGIVVEWYKETTTGSGGIKDYAVRLVKGGVIGSTDRASGSSWVQNTYTYSAYGTSSDLWGATWTPTDINASNFGTALAVQDTVGGKQGFVDYVRVTVYYTAAASGPLFTGLLKQQAVTRACNY